MAYIKNKLFTASAIALSATMAGAPVVSTMVQAAGNTTEVNNVNGQVNTTIPDPNDIFTDATKNNQKGSLIIHKYDFTEAIKDHPELYNGGSTTFKDRQADEKSQLTTDKDKNGDLKSKDVDGKTVTPYWGTETGKNGWRYESTGEKNEQVEKELANYKIPGVTFTYLKVSDVETYTKPDSNGSGDVKLVYEIPSELQEILSLDSNKKITLEGKNGDYFLSQDIINALKTALESNTTTKNKLETYIRKEVSEDVGVESNKGNIETDNNGVATTEKKIDLGLYLVVETKVPQKVDSTTNPFFVQIPMTHSDGESWFYDVNVYPKNETNTPKVDKYVRNNGDNIVSDKKDTVNISNFHEYKYMDSQTASEGDILDYKLVAKVPEITSSSTYLTKFNFSDEMDNGMSYIKADENGDQAKAVIAFYQNANDAYDATRNFTNVNAGDQTATEIWKAEDKDKKFTATVGTNNENGKPTLKVVTTQAGLDDINQSPTKDTAAKKDDATKEYAKHSGEYMVVYYQAKVNSDGSTILGDKGNENTVRLDWKRTNTEEKDTNHKGNDDHVEDKTYIFSYGVDLTKTLSDESTLDDADKQSKRKDITFDLRNTTDGYYVVATGSNGVYNVTGKSADEQGATQFTPNPATGKFVIRGIEGDTYTLTETHTSHGYMLLKDKIAIKITPRVVDTESTQADLTYHYTKGDKIPNTGVQGQSIDDEISPNSSVLPNNTDEESSANHKKRADDKNQDSTEAYNTNDNKAGTSFSVSEDYKSGNRTLNIGDIAPDSVIIANITEHSSATIDGKKCNMSADGQGDTASQNAIVPLTVLNSRGFTLPHTGGKGLIFLVAAGTVILGLVVSQNRKKEEKVGINKEN